MIKTPDFSTVPELHQQQVVGNNISRAIYVYFLVILVLILATLSEFTIKTDLFFIHLAGVQNQLIVLLVSWFVYKGLQKPRSFPKTVSDKSILLMLCFLIVSLCFSSNRAESLDYLVVNLLFFGFYYLSIDMITSRERLEHIISVVLFTGLLVVTFNLYYLHHNDFCSFGVLERYPFWTGKSPMGFYNTFLITFILGLMTERWKSSHKYKWVIMFSLLIGASVCLFFSFARSSWLTALIIIFIAGIIKFGRWFFYGSLIVFLIFSVIFSQFFVNLGLAVININKGNVDDRVFLWKSSLDMLRDHPLTGVGIGTYNINYLNSYQLLDSLRWNDSYHAHNVFLHIAAEQGYPGLIAFLIFWGLVFRQIYYNYKELKDRSDPFLKVLNTTVLLNLISYFLWSMTNTSISNVTKSFYNINLLVWFLTALVFSISKLIHADTSKPSLSGIQDSRDKKPI